MLAWSEGTDNGRQKTRNHDWPSLWASYLRLLRCLAQTCHAKPKTQISRTLLLLSRWWDAYRQAAWPEGASLRKSQDAVALQQIKGVALPMIDRGDIRQAIDRCSNIWASLPGTGYVSSSIRLTAWLQIQRSGPERSVDVWAESPRYTALVICIIVCLSWAVNHYRDNAIAYKSPSDKMPENWSWRTRQLQHADASAWCCARCKIHEGVSWC